MEQQEAAEILLQQQQDFAGAANDFFENTRTSASLVLGRALGALFELSHSKDDATRIERMSPVERRLTKAYRICAWFSFVLSLNAVVTCTVAISMILQGRRHRPNQNSSPSLTAAAEATTAFEFLQREFEYEFVSVGWSMIVTLLLLVVLVTLRLLVELDLVTNPARREVAYFLVLSSGALLAHLISYINASLGGVSTNLTTMTLDMVRVVVQYHTTTNNNDNMEEEVGLFVMKKVSMLASFGALYYGIRALQFSSMDEVVAADDTTAADAEGDGDDDKPKTD